MTVPNKFYRGETLNWGISLPQYPAPTWTLTYHFRGPEGGGFDVTATANGTKYAVTVPSADTTNCVPSVYNWQAIVTQGSSSVVVCSGTSRCVENLATVDVEDVVDSRSEARIALDAVRAMIAGKATLDQQSYTIGNRSLTRYSIPDLLQLEDRLARRVAKEEMKKRGNIMKQGKYRIWEGRR